MSALYQGSMTPAAAPAQSPAAAATSNPTTDTIHPREAEDAYRAVQLAVQQAMEANWELDLPRIAVVERKGIDTVYVSTFVRLEPKTRADVHGAVRAALAPYARLAPYTNVVFLTRGRA
jgi:hypothetical protein